MPSGRAGADAHALADARRSCRGRPPRRRARRRRATTPAQSVAKSSTTSSWVSVTCGITTTCAPTRDVGGEHAAPAGSLPAPIVQPAGTDAAGAMTVA